MRESLRPREPEPRRTSRAEAAKAAARPPPLGRALRPALLAAAAAGACILLSGGNQPKPAESFPLEKTLSEIGSLNGQIGPVKAEIGSYEKQISNAYSWLRLPMPQRLGFPNGLVFFDNTGHKPTDPFLKGVIEKNRQALRSDELKLQPLEEKLAADQKRLEGYLSKAPLKELRAKMDLDDSILDAFIARASPDELVSTKNEVYSEMQSLDSSIPSHNRNADRIARLDDEYSRLHAAMAKCGERCKGLLERVSESSFVTDAVEFVVGKALPAAFALWLIAGALTGSLGPVVLTTNKKQRPGDTEQQKQADMNVKSSSRRC
ncbi:MAG TPA: hypothetical protein VL945_01340 [Candidatus Saccharimonadales bacterium]|nr:hypothetical protein [Candidatus Saccharimonadales bacterium]